MSRLLGLREWLGFDDALRYMRGLGIDGNPKDFFLAYVEAGFPMVLSGQDHEFFTLIRRVPEESYPYTLGLEHLEAGVFETDRGRMMPEKGSLTIASRRWQHGYHKGSPVWVDDDVPFDPAFQDVAPIYHYSDHEGSANFTLLMWGDLMLPWAQEALQFKRSHVEALVKFANGEAAPEPTAASPSTPLAKPYLDPSHESYPPELAAAVMLWERLYIRGEKSQHHGHTQAAKLWLEKNRDSLPTTHLSNHGTTAWLDRLTSITSPDAKKQKR